MSTLLTLAGARSILPGEVLRSPKVTGLALHGNATCATWKLRYVAKSGIERRPKLGTYPTLSIEAAERVARDILEQVAAGKDPGGQWQLDRKSVTVSELCDMYVDKWANVRKVGTSRARDVYMLDKYVRPVLGRMRVRDVTLDTIETFLKRVHDRDPLLHPQPPGAKRYGRHDGKKTAPYQANRIRALLSKMFTLAESRFKIIDPHSSPVRGVYAYQQLKRRRFGTVDELPRIFDALHALTESHPREVAAIFTLFFTGARVNEIKNAKLSELINGDRLYLENHKTVKTIGPKTIYLPSNVIAIIATLPRSNSGLVFGNGGLRYVWKLARKAAGVPDLQLRDARRTFASVGLSNGTSLDAIGKHFGHTKTQTTEGYAWLLEDAAKALVNKTADQMAGLMAGK